MKRLFISSLAALLVITGCSKKADTSTEENSETEVVEEIEIEIDGNRNGINNLFP